MSTTTLSVVESYFSETDYLIKEVAQVVCIYYSSAIIIVGCVCNPLSLIVLSRKPYRGLTTTLYLRVVAAADLGAILNGATRFFLIRAFEVDTRFNKISCRVSIFCGYFFVYISCWTLVVVTVERVMSILWPHRVRTWCSQMAARVTLLSLMLAVCGISVWFSMVYGEVKSFDVSLNTTIVKPCAKMFWGETLSTVMWIVDALMFAFLSSFLLIVCNTIIIISVMRSNRFMLKPSPESSESGMETSQSCVIRAISSCFHRCFGIPTGHKTKTMNGFKKTKQMLSRSRRETSLTTTLLVINTAFIICQLPTSAFHAFGPHYRTAKGMGPIGDAISDSLTVLMYTNNALNFILYCLTGTKFRAELRATFQEIHHSWRRQVAC